MQGTETKAIDLEVAYRHADLSINFCVPDLWYAETGERNLTGSHSTVRLGHSRACVITKSAANPSLQDKFDRCWIRNCQAAVTDVLVLAPSC